LYLDGRNFQFQETLHNHDAVEDEKVEDVKLENSVSLPIPGTTSRSGSRNYSVCEGIYCPSPISPFGSLRDSTYEFEHSDRRQSQNFDKFQSRSSSLRSRHDNKEEFMGASDSHNDLPGTDTDNGVQGKLFFKLNLLLFVVGLSQDSTVLLQLHGSLSSI